MELLRYVCFIDCLALMLNAVIFSCIALVKYIQIQRKEAKCTERTIGKYTDYATYKGMIVPIVTFNVLEQTLTTHQLVRGIIPVTKDEEEQEYCMKMAKKLWPIDETVEVYYSPDNPAKINRVGTLKSGKLVASGYIKVVFRMLLASLLFFAVTVCLC